MCSLSSGYDSSYDGNTDMFVTKIQNGVRVYSTFVGGTGSDGGDGIAVDSNGRVYVTGGTLSTNFPTKNAYDSSHNGGYDVVVVKSNPGVSGNNSLLYSTYLGGSGDESGYDIAVNGSIACITGYTASTNFPTIGAYDGFYNNNIDAFVARVDPSSSGSGSLLYSTYLGGSGEDNGVDIAVDSTNRAYIVGYTTSADYPTKDAYDTTFNGGAGDVFMTKLNPTVSGVASLVYGTYFGGSGNDAGWGIWVDSGGRAHIVGNTLSTNVPMRNPYDSSPNGDADVLIAGFNPATSGNSSLVYSSYMGGSGFDIGYGIAVEGGGVISIVGWTFSSNFPFCCGDAAQISYDGAGDAFVAKMYLPTSGNMSRLFSIFLGHTGYDEADGVTVDSNGRIYITGYTDSSNFPRTTGSYAGAGDAFVTKMFPEYEPWCHWPHSAGATTTLTYDWGVGLTTPGTGWRNAFQSAITSWSGIGRIVLTQNATEKILMTAPNDPAEPQGAFTVPTCSGTTLTYARVVINTAVHPTPSQGLAAHEIGHAQGLGHIASVTGALMGNNAGTISIPQPLDIELLNLIYP